MANTTTDNLKAFNEKIKPYYSLLTMLLFFIALFISAYKYIISPSDLRVTVESDSITYPTLISQSANNITDYILSVDTLESDGAAIHGFLVQTTEFNKITLTNTSTKSLTGVRFKKLQCDALTGWGIGSDFLTSKEEQELKKNIAYDEYKSIVYLKNEVDIPPNGSIYIRLWGNFKPDLLGNNLVVTHNGGDGHIERSYHITGLKGYFFNYFFEIAIIVLCIFCIVFYVGVKQARKV